MLVVVLVVVLALVVLADDARGCSDGLPAPGCPTTTTRATTTTSSTTVLLPYDNPVPTVTRPPVVVMDAPQVIADVARAIPAAPSFTG